jgi:hypothetical protein
MSQGGRTLAEDSERASEVSARMSEDSETSSRDSMRRFQRGLGIFGGVETLAHRRRRASERTWSVARGVERAGLHHRRDGEAARREI